MSRNHKNDEVNMPFMAHLTELRFRLVRCLIGVGIGFALAATFAEKVFLWLMVPLDEAFQFVFHKNSELHFISVPEPFVIYFKTAIVAGLFISSPYVFFQLWRFISPGLKPSERRHGIQFVVGATAMFVTGAFFAYSLVLPMGFRYFLQLASPANIQPTITMREYFDFTSWTLILFGFVFEAPLLVLYLVYAGLIRAAHLVRFWRFIVVGLAVASAVLTPGPDPGTMLLMLCPLLVLYGVTILLAFVVQRPTKV